MNQLTRSLIDLSTGDPRTVPMHHDMMKINHGHVVGPLQLMSWLFAPERLLILTLFEDSCKVRHGISITKLNSISGVWDKHSEP